MSRRFLVAVAFSLLGAVGCTNTHSTEAIAPLDIIGGDVAHGGKVDKAGVKQKLAARRLEQMKRLEAYAAAGNFPENLTQPEPLHQLKDANGTYCAVANLVVQDGLGDVIDAKSRTENDLLFGDVKDGALYQWILDSGLTQEEVAEIQAPAPYEGGGRLMYPVPVPQPVDPQAKADAVEKLRAHFREVEAKILANTDASLEVATARLLDSREVIAFAG